MGTQCHILNAQTTFTSAFSGCNYYRQKSSNHKTHSEHEEILALDPRAKGGSWEWKDLPRAAECQGSEAEQRLGLHPTFPGVPTEAVNGSWASWQMLAPLIPTMESDFTKNHLPRTSSWPSLLQPQRWARPWMFPFCGSADKKISSRNPPSLESQASLCLNVA